VSTLLEQANFDIQTYELLEALDARNVHSRGDLESYVRRSLDLHRVRRGVHEWFCTMSWERHRLDSPKRPHIGWPCERGTAKIAETYAADTERES
jgi:hypothetical protein